MKLIYLFKDILITENEFWSGLIIKYFTIESKPLYVCFYCQLRRGNHLGFH